MIVISHQVVQSSTERPGTRSKSTRFRVSTVMLFVNAIAAILKSMVPTRTRCLFNRSKVSAAAEV